MSVEHHPVATRRLSYLVAITAGLVITACGHADRETVAETTPIADTEYTYRTASRDGTGKVYFGREISEVMGHLGAGWLEREGREREEATDVLVENLPLDPNSVVADIGAGTGYFSVPIAARVPDGRVIAIDIQQEMLDIIDARIETGAINNIETRLSVVDDPRIAPNSVDLVLIVDAYHEFSHPYEMSAAIAAGLKSGGKLVLIEYREEDPSVNIKPLHKMSEAQVKKEMAAVDLVWRETLDVLPQQHFLIFEKP
ncbi:MAG: class I SAM-dependent methyltransferase [Pseudomonadota bacterium]